MRVTGIDPGNTTAIVTFDPDTLQIINAELHSGLTLHGYTKLVEEHIAGHPADVYIESFFIQGRGNQRIQQVIGALKAGVIDQNSVEDVANTTVKKTMGRHGRAEKHEVANGCVGYFLENPESVRTIEEWIKLEYWDLTDALAIGVTGYHLKKMEALNGKAVKAKPKARAKKAKGVR
jgi:hypothetical protein